MGFLVARGRRGDQVTACINSCPNKETNYFDNISFLNSASYNIYTIIMTVNIIAFFS